MHVYIHACECERVYLSPSVCVCVLLYLVNVKPEKAQILAAYT